MPHPPVLGLTGGGGGGWGICLKNSPPGVGQLYNYVLHHYDIASLKLAHAHTVSAFTCCACVFVQAPKFNMDERKRVLVQFGDNCRCIVVPTTSETTQSERKLLEEEIRNVFSDLLAPRDKIYLQVKDEEWGGIFVDFFEDDVVHKSVFKMVAIKPVQVCTSVVNISCQFATMSSLL